MLAKATVEINLSVKGRNSKRVVAEIITFFLNIGQKPLMATIIRATNIGTLK